MSSVDSNLPSARDLNSGAPPRPVDRANDDADTCRICRGEAVAEEPLFYPCKCSGSIKYVHQDCLMEWLSHSQKKYCELCKTPFRFTKLYDPHMPNQIPTSVFIRRATIHVLKMFVTWCRIFLVAVVWLVLLPYCMRVVWRSLFWVGDGGFLRDLYIGTHSSSDTSLASSTALDLDGSSQGSNKSASLPRPGLSMPFSQPLNMTSADSTVFTMLKRLLFSGPFARADVSLLQSTQTPAPNMTANPLGVRGPSLLSEVGFLNWSPSQSANRFMIDVMEGQIITILVVVAFILIFLIREWVVQQQPVINMVAMGADAAVHIAPEPVEAELENEHDDHDDHEDLDHEDEHNQESEVGHAADDDIREEHGPVHEGNEDDDTDVSVVDGNGREHGAPRFHMSPALIEQWNLKNQRRQEQAGEDDEHDLALGEAVESRATDHPGHVEASEADSSTAARSFFPKRASSLPRHPETHNVNNGESSSSLQRPNMPARNRSFIATEIRRSMEERETWSFDAISEGSKGKSKARTSGDISIQPWEDNGLVEVPSSQKIADTVREPTDSENSSESWQQIPEIIVDDISTKRESIGHKGKARMSDNVDESTDNPPSTSQSEETVPQSTGSGEVHTPESGQHIEADMPEEFPEFDHDVHVDDGVYEDMGVDHFVPAADAESVNMGGQASESGVGPEQVREAERPPPRRWLGAALDWLFDDIPPTAHAIEDNPNDEHVQNLAAEAPFIPFAGNGPVEPINAPVLDQEVANAAAQAGIDLNDQDPMDEGEDLEGVMELIGMQGPLTGLFQNVMFSAVLISATLACAIWFPYLCGKVVILLAGSPVSLFVKLPVRLLAALCDLVVDTALVVAGGAVYWLVNFLASVTRVLTMNGFPEYLQSGVDLISGPSRAVVENAMNRIEHLVCDSSLLPNPDYFRLSVNSHAALRSIQNTTSYAYTEASNAVVALYANVAAETPSETVFTVLRRLPTFVREISRSMFSSASILVSWVWTAKSYNITLSSSTDGSNFVPSQSSPDPWTATDRLIAIFAGYTFFAMIGALYLKRGTPFSSSQQGKKIEAMVAEVLQQAGGVLKVILIISIEMLVFPLYCGLLLDYALLPLFENATLYTRWQWTRQNPWTSGFVHWFIGTCYMFHFALFVSMCRKIMRRGVLYFIRDPDDPTFHPVRDVLERSVTTQLRKIAFSGLVYGGLVLVCLGGVVTTLHRATTGILPIQWASHAPSVEFPMDLLFYNFLTPLIIKVYKPSDGLQAIYKWWFQTCARCLRLSHFLFGVEHKDEQGYHKNRPWFSWLIWPKAGDVNSADATVTENEGADSEVEDSSDIDDFVFDGKYVRAPASDQVRIPKGERVFVEVNENNERIDGNQHEGGVHNTDMVSKVYIPPWFRVRIALFVFTIWVFAAVTGTGITVTPLLFGRYLFSLFIPPTAQMNDIHAFSLGIYTLGAMAYSLYHLYQFIVSISQPIRSPLSTLLAFATTASKFSLRVLRFSYVWSSFVVLFPCLFALLLELYVLLPLHAYLGPKEPHVIHIIQDWTLGFLYARLAARLTFSNRRSRAARAFNAVVSGGYFDPNARIATRCFVVPVLAIFTVAVAVPASVAYLLNNTIWAGAEQTAKNQVWRFSFPVIGLVVATIWLGKKGVGGMSKWRMVVRDEVYLMGERLHNFGERRPANMPQAAEVKTGGRARG